MIRYFAYTATGLESAGFGGHACTLNAAQFGPGRAGLGNAQWTG